MALTKFWTIAFRDLGRNRRRSLFTLLAVGLGLALIILMSGYIAGVLDGAVAEQHRSADRARAAARPTPMKKRSSACFGATYSKTRLG